MVRSLAAVVLACLPVSAAYSNLIAVSGGTVYFKANTGLTTESWFVAGREGVVPTERPVADTSATGAVTATTAYGDRYCSFAGSTCFLQPVCVATFSINGPGVAMTNSGHRTVARLDRGGKVAWIDQDKSCPGLGRPVPPPLSGLYDTATMRLLAPSRGAKLATERSGRRLITDRGAMLTFNGPQLQWLDGAGARNVRHVNGAFEAVTDAQGANVVYVEAEVGPLHWIDTNDENLGLTGSAPLLSDDGGTLYFLDAEGAIRAYTRATRTVRRLGTDACVEIAASGDDLYAATADGRLLRIAITRGTQQELLAPLPRIEEASLPLVPLAATCPLYCYGVPERGLYMSRGMIVLLRGEALDQPGWRVALGDNEVFLETLNTNSALFVVPEETAPGTRMIEIFHPDHPLRVRLIVQVQRNVISCFGYLHQDQSRPVTAEDPSVPGETISLYGTGMQALSVPLTLTDAGAAEIVFSGSTLDLDALNQVNLRILRPWRQGTTMFDSVTSFNCDPPAVVRP